MYLKKIPDFLQRYYKQYRWSFPTEEKVVYLTFDDGPTPEITSWVMDQLDKYQAKATFFLVGDQVRRYPGLVHELIDQGHAIGNHTQSHVDGWQMGLKPYLREFLRCKRSIMEYTGRQTRLFRPPYGRLTHTKAKYIARDHDIIMMDVIAGDFDRSLSAKDCVQNVISKTQRGSIVVMHDSQKAWPRLEHALVPILAHFYEQGFRFETIPVSDRLKAPPLLFS